MPSRQIPGRPASGKVRFDRKSWLALVKDIYPAYISWSEWEKIQEKLQENQRIMQARLTRREGVRQGKAMLAGLVRCGKCGRKMQVAYKDNRFQYVCCKSVTELAQRSCQFLSGDRIDDSVLTAFFAAIQPTNIDALQATTQQQAAEREQRLKLIRQEVERLNYAEHRAERQYDKVDPENRLIAATLERKWEQAMDELERARSSLADSERAPTPILKISAGDRKLFSNVGQELPELEKQTVERVKKLTDEGFACDAIIDKLNAEGHIPCRGGQFTKAILTKLKVRYGIVSKLEQVRRGLAPRPLTPQKKLPPRFLWIAPGFIARFV